MTTRCRLLCHDLDWAQNFLAAIWPLIEIIGSLVFNRTVSWLLGGPKSEPLLVSQQIIAKAYAYLLHKFLIGKGIPENNP